MAAHLANDDAGGHLLKHSGGHLIKSVAIPVDDDFGGVNPNTTSVDDRFWKKRFPDSAEGTNNTQSISAGKLLQQCAGSAGGSNDCIARANTGISLAGTFTMDCDWELSFTGASPTGSEGLALIVIGITTTDIAYQYKTSDTDGGYYGRVNGSESVSDVKNQTSGSLRITRDSSDVIYCQYWNGSAYTTVKSATLAGTVDGYRLYTFSSGRPTDGKFDNFVVTDGYAGAGSTVYITM